jgi:ubiquinone/menaquinone biosynthesis C-methylase UbiE
VPDLHAGFQQPDADARHDGLFAFLEQVDGLPPIQAIKRRMADLLGPAPGQHLLEVGCGMGHELRRLAGRVAPGGSVRGIDMNQAMVEEARRRTADLGGAVTCQVGNVQQLELGDGTVDGVRTERVLMYVPDQQRAISELARVVRPGGRVVAFELDYGATLIDLPDQGTARRVLDVLGDTVAHRWTGRALARAFHQAGLRDIVTEPRPVTLPPGLHRQLVGPSLAAAVEAGTLEPRACRRWLAAARDAERGGYHCDAFTGMIAAARKPATGPAPPPPGRSR